MPTFTPAAFALELARARRAAIVESSNLMHALEAAGQSAAVTAAALGGLEADAEAEETRLVAALEAETKAKAQPKKRRARRVAEPQGEKAPPVPDAEVDNPTSLPESERAVPLGL